MIFTYHAYRNLVELIRKKGYSFASYKDWKDKEYCAILRHDIDNDIKKALELAKIENDLGVKSTYFVLVTSDFYNVFSEKNENYLKEILRCGHDIGLHFDEVRYPEILTAQDAINKIMKEGQLLSIVTGKPTEVVSMHRPSKMILEADLNIPGMINSYGQTFFKDFKYLSDSRRRWREPIEEIVNSMEYKKLHILTHAIWYNEKEKDIHDTIRTFINAGNMQRYMTEKSNITDIEKIMKIEEVT